MRRLFILLAVLLSDAMCAVVAYNYRAMECCAAHMGCSAPPDVAFLYAMPFLTGIVICLALAWRAGRKKQGGG